MIPYKKKIKLKVLAISLGSMEDRVRLGINDSRVSVYKVGMEVETESSSRDGRHFPFLPTHITATLTDHPCIGDIYSLTLEKEEAGE